MINIKRLETLEIEASTLEELQIEIKKYLKLGYKLDGEIVNSEIEEDQCPFYVYLEKNEFEN